MTTRTTKAGIGLCRIALCYSQLVAALFIAGKPSFAQTDAWYSGEKHFEASVRPGIPPDQFIDLTGDSIPDTIVTGYVTYLDSTHQAGYFKRGVKPALGVAFLMEIKAGGGAGFFLLKDGDELPPATVGGVLGTAHLLLGLHTKRTTPVPSASTFLRAG